MNDPSTRAAQDAKPIAVIAVALAVVIGGGTWWWLTRRGETPANTTPAAVTATEAPIDRPSAPPVDLPPLDQMDAFLRPLLQALSARPELVRWLATDDLLGQLAFAIDRASAGGSPARDFKMLAPVGPFAVSGRGSRRTIDPNSYKRYDGLVLTVTSIDASRVAQIYKTIRPRLNEAYRRTGNPGGDVDRAVHQALDILLDTPVVNGPIAVVEGDGASWVYADARLENLEPSQKQLVRMGPAHADALLVWLRALKNAL